MVASRPSLVSLGQLRFCNPLFFWAGEIHNHFSVWEQLLTGQTSSPVDLMETIRDVVKINHSFKPFKGDFKGSSYNMPHHLLFNLIMLRLVNSFGILSLTPLLIGWTLESSWFGAELVR